MTNGEAVVRW